MTERDILERLREDRGRAVSGSEGWRPLMIKAADEIERLRAALTEIIRLTGRHDLPDAWFIAERALEQSASGEVNERS